ncbi:hypothetical protein D2N39_11995 [Gemmobacter lutimaris]|uniref:Calcium-binding protein n=1 Tax=Gemmobacter lutimaris TaxID=2306023 RepID=A0A398BR90_9RHOB|nr:hypothetical protein [Gemmobacter lutimaris]RID91421.1 hypothetical protein D2N39_11995 [Gemmobacter lutimaris]
MAKLSNLVSSSVMRQSVAAMFNGGSASGLKATGFTLKNDAFKYVISASSLTYDIVNGELKGFPTGEVTGLKVLNAAGKLQFNITGLSLNAADFPSLSDSASALKLLGALTALDWTVTGTSKANEIRFNAENGLYSDNGVKITALGGNDTLAGGTGDDTISGGKGNDRIEDSAGNDSLLGDIGNDKIVQVKGAAGDDTMDGGIGNDRIDGGVGHDSLIGGVGDDTLNGGAGNDTMDGGANNDLMTGGAGNDSMSAGLGDDRMKGQAGNDTLLADVGKDTLDGGSGNDRLEGGDGGDKLIGGTGDDQLYGGVHADTLTGGAGADDFHFATGDGTDLITDFAAGEDRIFIQMSAEDELRIIDKNGDAVVIYGDSRVTLDGVSSELLVMGENLVVETLL